MTDQLYRPRSLFIPGFSVGGLVEVAVILSLAGPWLGLLGRWHWVLDLFTHFHWQYAVISLLALLWLGFRRRWLQAGAALATLLFSAFLLTGDRQIADFKDGRMRVVSLNVLAGLENKEPAIEWMRKSGADVLLLYEVDGGWAAALQSSLKSEYPHQFIELRSDNFGVAALSRVTMEAELVQGPNSITTSVQAKVSMDGQPLLLLGIHPVPPMGEAWATARDNQMTDLARHVAAQDLPVLVAGDFNASPWSVGVRLLRTGNSLGFRAAFPMTRPTWMARSIFAIPIDLVMTTPQIGIVEREVGPDVGSDHRPQVLDIGWLK